MWSIVFAFIPKRYLYGAAAIAALVLGSYAALAVHNRALKSAYFDKGYAFAADSAREATILRLAAQHAKDTLRAAESARAARDSSSALVAESRRFDTVTRHTPRIEALPDSFSRLPKGDLVRVIVANTGDTIEAVPRRAAVMWFTADSLLGVSQRLLAKYAAANRAWSEAWHSENEARIGADSLSALWRARALANIAPPPRNMHRIAYLALGVAAGFLAAKRIH